MDGPILPLLLRLALPNVVAMLAAAAVNIAETAYAASLGRDALAGVAVVFPFAMLMQTLSIGGMGGAVASAISRALGARDRQLADMLVAHALLVGLACGIAFCALFLLFGRSFYSLLGARGAVLEHAALYSAVMFAGTPVFWVGNSLVSALRGTGAMRITSLAVLLSAGGQVLLGGFFAFGLGSFRGWGVAGLALGQVLASAATAIGMAAWVRSGRAGVRPDWRGAWANLAPAAAMFRAGLLASLSPAQSVLILLALTGFLAHIGVDALAGYGMGARLEFVIIPISFGIGVAAIPMIGSAMGAGNVLRARQVAWTAGAVAATVGATVGGIVALAPAVWTSLFDAPAEVKAHAADYLRWAGPAYALFALGLTLFFASQAAGRVLGPVLGSSVRLAVVLIGGSWLTARGAPPWQYFALIGAAMVAYGLFTASSVLLTRWQAPPRLQPAGP